MHFIDTHTHLYTSEFQEDRAEVIARARQAGAQALLLPCIDEASLSSLLALCRDWPGFCFPMIGLHPTELPAEPESVLDCMERCLAAGQEPFVAVGEVGIDLYWDKSRREEQISAFRRQAEWAARYDLPLMIHSRSAHRELVDTLLPLEPKLRRGGVFHCFSGSVEVARELLERFPRFSLGIGGVLTFKGAHLAATLHAAVPLERIVVETDAPYLAPTPHRGSRNEPAYLPLVIARLAEIYDRSEDDVCQVLLQNTREMFGC